MAERTPAEAVNSEWIEFPGGELEGRRPKVRCQACREKDRRESTDRPAEERGAGRSPSVRRAPLCFQCYRAELEFTRALKSAGQLDTASAARFQAQLPFEPVNTARLERLRAERATAHAKSQPLFADKRRHAQLAARRALQRMAAGINERASREGSLSELRQRIADVAHAAELQLPESWLSFVSL